MNVRRTFGHSGRSSGNHVYHFAILSLLIFTLTLVGTIGISFTGAASGYEAFTPYTLETLNMFAFMWVLALAFLIPAELMIRNSRT